MENKPEISLVIPVFNEEESIPHLFKKLDSVFEGIEVEYVLVDDGSSDRSVKLLREEAGKRKNVRLVLLSRNFGHQNAIRAGMEYCNGDYIAFIDADLQDPPDEILPMVETLKEGADLVYGVRKKRDEGFLKKFPAWLFYRLLNKISKVNIPVDAGDFSVMTRDFLKIVRSYSERNLYIRGLRSYSGFIQVPHYYSRPEREFGDPSYTFFKSLSLAFSGIISFTSLPLKMMTYIGFLTTILSFVFGGYVLLKKLFGGINVEGWTSLAIIMTFFFGLQFFFLGVIGEYLSKIYDESKNRPNFIVKEVINE